MNATRQVTVTLWIWIVSHIGHAILAPLYEQPPAAVLVPVIYLMFAALAVCVALGWPRATALGLIAAFATVILQTAFIWNRTAYGPWSVPVLAFDLVGVAASLLYLWLFFSKRLHKYVELQAERRTSRLTER